MLDAIGFYQENRDHDESVYHKMERAHALNEDLSPRSPHYEDEFIVDSTSSSSVENSPRLPAEGKVS